MGKAGASVAGTEFAFRAANVAPNGAIEWFGMARMDVADYLTGNASAAGLTISGEAEIGVA